MSVPNIRQGAIFFDRRFTFQDGDESPKYLIILEKNPAEFPKIICIAARVRKFKGPMIDTVTIEANESEFFPQTTVIDLKRILEESFQKPRPYFLEAIRNTSEHVQFIGNLESEILNRILSAVESAVTLPATIICRIHES